MISRTILFTIAVVAVGISLGAQSQPPAPGPTPQERVAALKQTLQESQTRIRNYEWIETTIVSLKGEEKSRNQKRCYYGADGTLQKLPVGGAPSPQPEPQSGGRRGGRLKAKVVENKKDDMKEYVERAAALVKQYVPPNPADIQRAKDAGKVTTGTAGPGRARLEFVDYIKPADRLSIDVDPTANRLLGLAVATYLDKPEDAVTLAVELGSLNDGTSYTAQTTLDATAKQIRIVIQNAGYRPVVR
jgi:hypothetical protein